MSNQEAYEDMCGKAKAYDYLIEEFEEEKRILEEKAAQNNSDLDRSWDRMAALVTGRKYITLEFIAWIERVMADAEFIRKQS